MKRISFAICGLIICGVALNGSQLRDAPTLFEKKCKMCHLPSSPKTMKEYDAMSGPAMNYTIKNLVWGMDSEYENLDSKKMKEVSIAFMKDYLFAPDRKKTNCEDISFEKFGVMPNLKGFITDEELDILLPWVYDRFKPTKIKGSWEAVK